MKEREIKTAQDMRKAMSEIVEEFYENTGVMTLNAGFEFISHNESLRIKSDINIINCTNIKLKMV